MRLRMRCVFEKTIYARLGLWHISRLPFFPETKFPRAYMDNVIASQELQVERKHYYIEFRENERGRFLRITEEAHGRRNTVIVPSTGLNEFNAAIDAVVVAANAANGTSAPGAPSSPLSGTSVA